MAPSPHPLIDGELLTLSSLLLLSHAKLCSFEFSKLFNLEGSSYECGTYLYELPLGLSIKQAIRTMFGKKIESLQEKEPRSNIFNRLFLETCRSRTYILIMVLLITFKN
jgi:hypothetical protein